MSAWYIIGTPKYLSDETMNICVEYVSNIVFDQIKLVGSLMPSRACHSSSCILTSPCWSQPTFTSAQTVQVNDSF